MSATLGNITSDITKVMDIYNIIEPLIPELGELIKRLNKNLSVADIVQLQAEVEDARRENEIAIEKAKSEGR